MNTKHLQLIVLATACLVVAACETTTTSTPNRFVQADANNDKALSLDETNTYLVIDVFSARDTNDDKQLTLAEWTASNDPAEAKSFRDRDANRDGNVTLDEALAYGRKKGMARQLIRDADSNKDGQLSAAEITTYYASREGPTR